MDIWKRRVDQAILDALSKAIEERKLRDETEDAGFARLLEMQAVLRAKIEAEAASPRAAPPRRPSLGNPKSTASTTSTPTPITGGPEHDLSKHTSGNPRHVHQHAKHVLRRSQRGSPPHREPRRSHRRSNSMPFGASGRITLSSAVSRSA